MSNTVPALNPVLTVEAAFTVPGLPNGKQPLIPKGTEGGLKAIRKLIPWEKLVFLGGDSVIFDCGAGKKV